MPAAPDPAIDRRHGGVRSVKLALLFPGQGSQYPGMADPWLGHPAGKEVLAEASDVLGYDVVDAGRDESRLAQTDVVQPVLFACDLAAARVLEAEGLAFSIAAGHSLGEFVALAAAGVVPMDQAIRAVIERGLAMQEASDAVPGGMTALVGLSPEEAAEVCAVAGRGDVLTVANENSPKQTVLSGSIPAIERAEELARSRKVKAVRLKVAGAFHSKLMEPALPRVRAAIARLDFSAPRFPIVPNVSGRPTDQAAALRDLLSRHLVSPVRWERSIRAMAEAGVDLFVEAGPGDVLAKLVKRCVPGAKAVSVGSPDDAAALVNEIGANT
jgi:[acyl-carrier-protein] S-malonyltransferase